MRRLAAISELRAHLGAARVAGRTVGLVPTMGFLHDGHVSLMHAAVADCDEVVATIFVNPLQFAPGEDLAAYPRDPEGDAAKIGAAGVGVLFSPSVEEMYPTEVVTSVVVDEVSLPMEGESRPTHFSGVATVVAKLFSIVGECRAYFGEKDYQQLAVIRRMAADLSMPVEVVGCPIVREPDGLAMSSRNVYLTQSERAAAPVVRRALLVAVEAITAGEADPAVVRGLMRATIEAEAEASLDYVEVADPETLQPVEKCDGHERLFVAAHFGKARLIDNCASGGGGPA